MTGVVMGLGAKVIGGAAIDRVKNEISYVPKWLWYVLAIVLVLAVGSCAHENAKDKFEKQVRAEERKAVVDEYNAKAKVLLARAEKIRREAEGVQVNINKILGATNAKDVSSINAHAQSLLMRGPRQTQCVDGAAGVGMSGVPGSSNRPGPGPRGNAKVAGPGVWVDWFELVEKAKLCDIDTRALKVWERWWYEQSEADRVWRDKMDQPVSH